MNITHRIQKSYLIFSPTTKLSIGAKMVSKDTPRDVAHPQNRQLHLSTPAESDDAEPQTNTQGILQDYMDEISLAGDESDGDPESRGLLRRSDQEHDLEGIMENVEEYKPGGFYPLHVDDRIHGGRFTIIHKLGFGGYSTVWLSRDNVYERYVAVKVGLADDFEDNQKSAEILKHIGDQTRGHQISTYIGLPLESFAAESPNGTHMCHVFPFWGPSIATLCEENHGTTGLDGKEARTAALQISQTLAFLHSPEVGIGHGDLTSSNVLLEIANFDHLSTEQIYEIVGYPRYCPTISSGGPLTSSAPDYFVPSIDPLKLFQYRTGNIKVIDFGSCYRLDSPPTVLAVAAAYRSPELVLHDTVGREGDVWALASVIFQTMNFGQIFECYSNWDRELLSSMRSTLGPFPTSMLTAEYLEAGFDKPPKKNSHNTVEERLWGATKTVRDDYRPEIDYAMEIQRTRGFEKLRNYFMWAVTWRPRHAKGVLRPATMSNDEMGTFNDLITKMVDYKAEKRPTSQQVLYHPWFSKVFENPSLEEWKREG